MPLSFVDAHATFCLTCLSSILFSLLIIFSCQTPFLWHPLYIVFKLRVGDKGMWKRSSITKGLRMTRYDIIWYDMTWHETSKLSIWNYQREDF